MKKNFYEVTFVINPVLEEEQVKEVKENFEAFVNEKGAEIEEVEEWGIKRLAYEIDGKNSGYYVNAYFVAPSEIVSDLERYFKLQENVMRHLVLKYDNKMLKHRELKKQGKLPVIFTEVPEEEQP
ncbi:30S ribosomal protein S6 [Balneolaceae bacterium ANBcel3]|nr:30S ribosomal protein S6 [Balneolaceae bacterium ANBcel3]